MIRLFFIAWLIAGSAMATDNPKSRGLLDAMPVDSPSPPYKGGKGGAVSPKSDDQMSREELARHILNLPPLTAEQVEKFEAEDKWRAGLRQAPSLQKRPTAGPAFKRNPWDD